MKNKNRAKITSASSAKTSSRSVQPLHANKELLVDVDNLTVKFGNDVVLDNVSFCIHAGEFMGLIGTNGAGKTTLLRAILGLIPDHQGKISKKSCAISYIPQHGNTYSGIVPMSVMEVVKIGANGSAELAKKSLAAVGVENLARKRFTDLSGGQRQRVTIAKALASDPDVLILDEPTTGIDEQSQTEFYKILDKLNRQGITIVMVAHEIDTVTKHANRIVAINRGILYDGPPEDFAPEDHRSISASHQHALAHHGGHHA